MEASIFVVLTMLQLAVQEKTIKGEHVSMIIGSNYLLSFQEDAGDVFDTVRERIRKEGRIRRFGPDYLA